MVDNTPIEVITNPEIIRIIAEKQTRIEDLSEVIEDSFVPVLDAIFGHERMEAFYIGADGGSIFTPRPGTLPLITWLRKADVALNGEVTLIPLINLRDTKMVL